MELNQIAELFETSDVMTYAGIGGLFMLAITMVEIVFDLLLEKKRDWRDTSTNIVIGLLKEVISSTVLGAVGVVALYFVSTLQHWQMPMTGWSWVLGIVLADLTYYWMHRFEHENRLLWAHHSVHHSSRSYNLTVGFRLSIIEDFVEWIFLIPMVLIGFNVFQTFGCLIVVVIYQHWIHTEKIGKLGVLDKWFNTPSVHRVHHGSNAKYLDRNYGGILMLWDHLFGTYQPEEERVKYGLVKNIETYNPVTINFIEYGRIWRDMKQCRTLRDKLRVALGGTSWRPEYLKERTDLASSVSGF